MHSVLRPNYRRARTLALEIEAAKYRLDDFLSDSSVSAEEIDDLRSEIRHLESEFSKTGVTSEYDL